MTNGGENIGDVLYGLLPCEESDAVAEIREIRERRINRLMEMIDDE